MRSAPQQEAVGDLRPTKRARHIGKQDCEMARDNIFYGCILFTLFHFLSTRINWTNDAASCGDVKMCH